MNIVINPKYLHLNDFVVSLPDSFAMLPNSTTLHQARNCVKAVECQDVKLVIKCYFSISLVNRLIYGRLRRSKSMRAYHNAIKLLEVGIRTPLPIGAIDSYNNGLLKSSFFVSEYSDYTPMTVIHSPLWEKDIELLKAVAQFFAQIHQLGIQHNDLNAANVRYRIGEEGYEFELIDNNRIRFKNRPLTERERLIDLRHFACGTVQYVFMLEQYALLTGIDKEAFATKGVVSKFGYDLRVGFRRMLKSKFR